MSLARRIALGTAQLGMPYGLSATRTMDVATAESMIRFAREKGIDTLDTAIAYESSEAVLGQIGVHDFRIVTKLPSLPATDTAISEWVRSELEGAIRRLRVPQLHAVLLHRPRDLLSERGQELARALVAAKESGLVQRLGISIYNPSDLERLLPRLPTDIVQAPMNVFDRRLEAGGWLQRLKQLGIEIHARSAYLQGLLLLPEGRRPARFRPWASQFERWDGWRSESGVSAVQACLGHVLSYPEIAKVVVGADDQLQLAQTLDCAAVTVRVPEALSCPDERLIDPFLWPPKVVGIVQARMGSTRLPRKVMRPVVGVPLIEMLLRRLSKARKLDQIIVATSPDPLNAPLVRHVESLGFGVFEGSETDVLDRYRGAARSTKADVVVRITGDCPLIDPNIVDLVVEEFLASGADYVSNVDPPTFPNGLDVEVFTVKALERAWTEAREPFDREHVTPFLRTSGLFRLRNVSANIDASTRRWTVDEAVDLEVVDRIFAHFQPRTEFTWQEVLELEDRRPELFASNRDIARNEGATMSTGQKLWKRAKSVIPGGNMLLSKRSEMFLPERWPAYFSRAKGCRVWDLDGREYVDMSIMGIGTNTLGYGHDEIDDAVSRTIAAGNMSTLNCPEEVYLAEKLVEMHPWADMVRLARTGGEANAIAIRIARAASGRSKVAFCGYHGWHDWYLAANLAEDNGLSGHLLPGLEPNGVPESLRGTVLPFNYNRFDELVRLSDAHDIGVIKMEVSRNFGPEPGFLENVRKLATDRGIVLIFDECTSGFRQTLGGLHLQYGVEPDMAMFGKALGNGYAITATIGRRAVMEAAQTTFISSTFWTERIGPTAALKTLEVMEKTRSYEIITAIGEAINRGWQALATRHGLSIAISGLPALTSFSFQSPNALAYKTLVTQEMLAKGYLAGTSVYTCIDHTPALIEAYLTELDRVFGMIRKCEDGRLEVSSLLKGPVCHGGFKRLN